MKPDIKSYLESLAAGALIFPGVEESVACKGTKIESRKFTVRKKSFLHLREKAIMLRLSASLDEANRLGIEAGSGGWITVRPESGPVPDLGVMTGWVTESYELSKQ